MILDIHNITEHDLYFRSLFYSNGREYLRVGYVNTKQGIKYKISSSVKMDNLNVMYFDDFAKLRNYAADIINTYGMKKTA